MGKTHRIDLTPDDIEMLLDYLAEHLTDKEFKKNRKRAEHTHELYQTIGQALGEKNIILEFEEAQ